MGQAGATPLAPTTYGHTLTVGCDGWASRTGIKLTIEAETPLSADDRDILAGISVMVLAIANRQNLVDQDVPPRPCSLPNPDNPNLYCVAAVGHGGDHLYDELGDLDGLAPPSGGMN